MDVTEMAKIIKRDVFYPGYTFTVTVAPSNEIYLEASYQ